MPHPINGLKELTLNPVIKSVVPIPNTATALYTVPGAPFDTEVQVLRVSNPGSGNGSFWVGFSTQANPTPVYFENGSAICGGDSRDVFALPIWLPPTTTIWVKANSAGVIFGMLGTEVFSNVGDAISQRTGS